MTSTKESGPLSDSAIAHRRNHIEYSYHLPTPPRITVPPPGAQELDNVRIKLAAVIDPDLAFLREWNLEESMRKDAVLEWSYERRRQAQMILPWLYLGPMVAAKDRAFLEREGITMAVPIRARENSMAGAIDAVRAICPEVVPVDAPTLQDLIARFPATIATINSHVARFRQSSLERTGQPTLGKVLVFCESGNEQAATVVAAYLMEMLDSLDYIKAMQICQVERFSVNFDESIKQTLRAYWDVLQARRAIESTAHHSTAGNHLNGGPAPTIEAGQKRRIEHTFDGEDTDMVDLQLDLSDELRFAGRDLTPFQNRNS